MIRACSGGSTRGGNVNGGPTSETHVSGQKFHVVVERDEDGLFVATVTELPGCHTQARTRRELTSRVREAIRVYREEPRLTSVGPSFVAVQTVEV